MPSPATVTPRPTRPDAGLSAREVSTLRWIAAQEAVRADVVAQVLGGASPFPPDRTRRVLDRWRRAGLIERERLLAVGPPVCWLTRRGAILVGARPRRHPPTLGRLDHLHAVSLVRLGTERSGGTAWTSERALSRERRRADEHVADGRYVTATGVLTAVEVELTVKTPRRLRSIVDDLTIEYPAVLYVVRGPSVRRAVERAVDTLGEQQHVTVVDLARFELPRPV